MKRNILNFNFISFQLLLFSLLIIFNITTSSEQSPNPLQGLACSLINCGEGICVASNASLLGFDCECNQGWKKIQIGHLAFPSCVVPNCTIDFQCGNGAPPPPPPPPTNPPPFNLSNPCNLIWCGEGTCVVNGTGHYCQCFDGSENLFDQTALACFKQCALGADCGALGLGPHPPPPPSSSASTRNGSNEAANCLRNLHALIIIVLSATFLT